MVLEGYHSAWLVVTFIVIFFLVRLAVGIWAGSKVQNNTDYIVAGRRLPIYMASASIMATWFAAETLMGASETAYDYGFQGVVFDPFGAAMCLFLSGVFFVRLMRRAKYLTVVDFFERRYNKTMTVLSVIAQMLTYFSWTAAQIVAGGAIVNGLFGIDPAIGMVAIIVVVAAYTSMGGMLGRYPVGFLPDVPDCRWYHTRFSERIERGWRFPGSIRGSRFDVCEPAICIIAHRRRRVSGLHRYHWMDVLAGSLDGNWSRFGRHTRLDAALHGCP